MEIIEPYYNQLISWSGLMTFSPIYDTNSNEQTSSAINSAIRNRKNILIVITTTEGYLFGSFIEKEIPNAKSQLQYVKDGINHFVFTLKNSFQTEPTMLKRKNKKGMTLAVLPTNETKILLMIKKCFCLYEKGKGDSKVHYAFNQKYNDTTEYSCCLFTGEDFINWERVVIYQGN